MFLQLLEMRPKSEWLSEVADTGLELDMEKVIRRCEALPDCLAITLDYASDNEEARRLHRGVGFEQTGASAGVRDHGTSGRS